MHNFAPTVCRDNFFEDPHKIIELSKQIDFKPTNTYLDIGVIT